MKLLAARISHLVPPADWVHVGDFISPRAYQQLGRTPVWAADNDAFSGFNPDRYRRMLDRILQGVIARAGAGVPAFITRALPRAFVLQNGIEEAWNQNCIRALPWLPPLWPPLIERFGAEVPINKHSQSLSASKDGLISASPITFGPIVGNAEHLAILG